MSCLGHLKSIFGLNLSLYLDMAKNQGAPAGKVRRKQLPWVCTVSVQIGRRQGESYKEGTHRIGTQQSACGKHTYCSIVIISLISRSLACKLGVINSICDHTTVPWCFFVGDSSHAAEDDVVDRFDCTRFRSRLSL